MITEFALAMQHDLTIRDLASTIHAYSTYGMGIQRLLAQRAMTHFLTSTPGKLLRRFNG